MNIGLIGDYNATVPAHQAIPRAIGLAAEKLQRQVSVEWVPTEQIHETSRVSHFNGLWCVPASPYRRFPLVVVKASDKTYHAEDARHSARHELRIARYRSRPIRRIRQLCKHELVRKRRREDRDTTTLAQLPQLRCAEWQHATFGPIAAFTRRTEDRYRVSSPRGAMAGRIADASESRAVKGFRPGLRDTVRRQGGDCGSHPLRGPLCQAVSQSVTLGDTERAQFSVVKQTLVSEAAGQELGTQRFKDRPEVVAGQVARPVGGRQIETSMEGAPEPPGAVALANQSPVGAMTLHVVRWKPA